VGGGTALTRVAASHVRIGTIQYFVARQAEYGTAEFPRSFAIAKVRKTSRKGNQPSSPASEQTLFGLFWLFPEEK